MRATRTVCGRRLLYAGVCSWLGACAHAHGPGVGGQFAGAGDGLVRDGAVGDVARPPWPAPLLGVAALATAPGRTVMTPARTTSRPIRRRARRRLAGLCWDMADQLRCRRNPDDHQTNIRLAWWMDR